MIIVIGIFALFYLLLGLWTVIHILKGKRIRWPISRNEGRKMFEGWVATRRQIIDYAITEIYGDISDLSMAGNHKMAFDRYGQEIH